MKKIKDIISWILAVICLLLGLTAGLASKSYTSAFLLLVVGVSALPIKPIRNLWEIKLKRKALPIRIISLTILFLVAIMCVPTSSIETNDSTIVLTNSSSSDESVDDNKESLVKETDSNDSKIKTDETKTESSEAIEDTQQSEPKVEEVTTTVATNVINSTNDDKTTLDQSATSQPENNAIETPTATNSQILPMEVHFLNIGQGDCTLIKCGDEAMLIDAGDNDMGTTVQLYLTKQNVKKLKYFVVTHDDSDHEGGADVIITKFDIENLFMCAFPKDTKTHNDVLNAANYKSLSWRTPTVGETFTLGSASITIIAPNKTYDNPNNSSIALLVKNGNNTFLFTGDCEEDAENDILKNGIDVKADVYQVGHHGSATSSSQRLLDAVKPTYAVISCGAGNSYGHPRAETLLKFQTMGIQMFRTDDQGTVVAISDGTNITWNMTPSTNWAPGEPNSSSTQTATTASTDSTAANVTVPDSTVSQTMNSNAYVYTVNQKNGKIHFYGTSHGPKEANSKHFATLEEAQANSATIKGQVDYCQTCFK